MFHDPSKHLRIMSVFSAVVNMSGIGLDRTTNMKGVLELPERHVA